MTKRQPPHVCEYCTGSRWLGDVRENGSCLCTTPADVPRCEACAKLGAAIDSGIRYCHGRMTWQWASDRVAPCSYRTPVDETVRLGHD